MRGDLVSHLPGLERRAGADIHEPTDGARLQKIRHIHRREMHGSRELAQPRREQRLLFARMVDRRDLTHEFRHLVHQRRQPLGIEVFLPAQAVFAVFHRLLSQLVRHTAVGKHIAGHRMAGGTQICGKTQRLPQHNRRRADEDTGEEDHDVAPGHARTGEHSA